MSIEVEFKLAFSRSCDVLSTIDWISKDKMYQFSKDLFDITNKWGRVINITTALSPKSFLTTHFYDACCSYLVLKANTHSFGRRSLRVVDVGCGGGFVGLVWSFLSLGQIEMSLLDPDRKRINFCKQVTRELKLPNLSFFQMRVEDFICDSSHAFDFVVSRATWDSSTFFSKCGHLRNSKGVLVHFSSADQVKELVDPLYYEYFVASNLPPRYLLLADPAGLAKP